MLNINFDIMPPNFEKIADDIPFDANKHLALEKPSETLSLHDLGYEDNIVADCPSDFGVSNAFRLLSNEGVEALLHITRQLKQYYRGNFRIDYCTRGGVYRSQFLRDLCLNPDITAFISEICNVALIPHTIPHQLGHINYNPEIVGKNIDKWHVDTLRYDYVLFVTDPNKIKGGAFQYFKGTKTEMADYKDNNKKIPKHKVIAPDIPAAGYAIMQQGNMVVHQAKALLEPAERITMVNGYIPKNPDIDDFTRYDQLFLADPSDIVTAEYTRHIALQSMRQLEKYINNYQFSNNRDDYISQLEKTASLLQNAANNIKNADKSIGEDFGD